VRFNIGRCFDRWRRRRGGRWGQGGGHGEKIRWGVDAG
jgi:hypothetical protein